MQPLKTLHSSHGQSDGFPALNFMIKHRLRLGLVLAATLLAACKTKTVQVYPVPSLPEGYAKSSQEHSGPYTGQGRIGTVGNVRTPELVKVYGVNRYVDPVDPRMMHERHAVYRLEEQPHWVVRTPNGKNKVLLGPIVGLNRPEYKPAPEAAELGRELMTARRSVEEGDKYLEEIKAREGVLESAVKKSLDNQEKLNQVTKELADKVERLDKGGVNSEAPQSQAQPQLSPGKQ
jgi:hypothetical protein